jgi:DNA replication protein DnaC
LRSLAVRYAFPYALRYNVANVLFQVVNERYLERKPIIFTTNKPLAAWGIVLHDPDLAEAILDRVLELAHVQRRSMRRHPNPAAT